MTHRGIKAATQLNMDKEDEILNEAVEGIISLKKNYKVCASEDNNECVAVLIGSDWRYEVRSAFFRVKDLGNCVICEFLVLGRIWVLKVENGCAKVDEQDMKIGESLVLKNDSFVKVGNLLFRFSLLQRSDKLQKNYKNIIIEALKASPTKKLSLAEIYSYFENKYGFPQEDSTTWKNSIRHNLSVNNIFKRVPRDENIFSMRGMLWTIADSSADKGKDEDISEIVDYRSITKHKFGKNMSWLQEKEDNGNSMCEEETVHQKRRISSDGYPNKRFKQTIIPRVTGYVSIPVSYAFEHLLTKSERAKFGYGEVLLDVSYDVPDFSSECSSDIFSCGDSDRQALTSQKSHSDIFEMSESDNLHRARNRRNGRRPFN